LEVFFDSKYLTFREVNTLLMDLATAGNIDKCAAALEKMREKGFIPNEHSYCALVLAGAKSQPPNPERSLEAFRMMERGSGTSVFVSNTSQLASHPQCFHTII
jgi:pentatricopeptide repeat protein